MLQFFVVPSRKELRFTYFHFFRIPSNSTYAKAALSYCGFLLWNFLLSFHKALKTFLFKQFVAERF